MTPRDRQIAALAAAFPDYTFRVVIKYDQPRYEAVAKKDQSLYCLISADVQEIWRELRAASSETPGFSPGEELGD